MIPCAKYEDTEESGLDIIWRQDIFDTITSVRPPRFDQVVLRRKTLYTTRQVRQNITKQLESATRIDREDDQETAPVAGRLTN